jgi:hypothetical protein
MKNGLVLSLFATLVPLAAHADAGDRSGTPGALPDAVAPAAPAPGGEADQVLIFVLPSAAGLSVSDAYDAARAAIEANTTLTVLPQDVFSPSAREAVAADFKRCAGNSQCFAGKVAEAGIPNVEKTLLLTISAGRLEEGALLGLRLVSMRSKSDVSSPVGEEIAGGVNLTRAIKDYVERVFPTTIWRQIASLNIEVDAEGASVDITNPKGPPRSCVSPSCKLTRLRPDTYEVSVSKVGYKRWTGKTTLQAGDNASVKVALQQEESGFVGSGVFWGIVAAAVVGGAVGGYFLFRQTEGPVTVCIARDPSLCKQ